MSERQEKKTRYNRKWRARTMYEELTSRLKYLATLEVKNGESVIHVTAEAAEAIREIAQEAADAIKVLLDTAPTIIEAEDDNE